MTVEHSEQAKAEFPDVGLNTPEEVEFMRLGYDRAVRKLAERRITDRETLIATADRTARDRHHDDICMCSDYPASCVTYGSAEALHPYFDAETVVDDLLASGLVKDNGDEWIPCSKGICAGRDGHAGSCAAESGWDDEDEPAPVDRLAVIREVIDWLDVDGRASKYTLRRAVEHFGVAPVEEEA